MLSTWKYQFFRNLSFVNTLWHNYAVYSTNNHYTGILKIRVPNENRDLFLGAFRSHWSQGVAPRSNRGSIKCSMSNLSVAKCTRKYSITTISSGENLSTVTLVRHWSRTKRPTPPINYSWSYTFTINTRGPGNFYCLQYT